MATSSVPARPTSEPGPSPSRVDAYDDRSRRTWGGWASGLTDMGRTRYSSRAPGTAVLSTGATVNDRKKHRHVATNRPTSATTKSRSPQDYHLAEASHEDAFDEDYRIRSCDLGALPARDDGDQRRFAERARRSVARHRLRHPRRPRHRPGALRRRPRSSVVELFTTHSASTRSSATARAPRLREPGLLPDQGDQRHPSRSGRGLGVLPARLRPRRPAPTGASRDFWPRPELEPLFRRLCLAHERADPAGHAGPPARPRLRPAPLRPESDAHQLRPAPELLSAARAEDDASGAGRLLGHEDVDLFTFLPAPRIEGLQVLNRRNMKWVRLQAPPGSIVLNTGDYMQRITNDVLPSTTHRVSPPRDPGAAAPPRVSSRWPSTSGRTSCSRSCQGSARRSTRRSKRSSSTRARPASSTAIDYAVDEDCSPPADCRTVALATRLTARGAASTTAVHRRLLQEAPRSASSTSTAPGRTNDTAG